MTGDMQKTGNYKLRNLYWYFKFSLVMWYKIRAKYRYWNGDIVNANSLNGVNNWCADPSNLIWYPT